MAYIVQRRNRFYVVAYDGTDHATGRERRRWHPAGRSRADAEAIAARLDSVASAERRVSSDQFTLGRYLTERWMPRRRQGLQATTAHRYQWIIEHYIVPELGSIPLRALCTEHLDRFYADLLATGGRDGNGLAPKTVYDVHVVIRSALNQAVRQHLVLLNVAHGAQPPRARRQRTSPECWTAPQLAQFLASTRHLRLYPALHLAATTGMRRGELAGLRWGDWQPTRASPLHRPEPPSRRRSIGRSPGQDPIESTLHRPRPRHRGSARDVAATPRG
jgi:integrase